MSSGEASTRSRFLLGGINPIFPVLPAGTLHGGLTVYPPDYAALATRAGLAARSDPFLKKLADPGL